MAKFSLKLTKRYLRDLKLARKRGMDENLLNEIIGKLLNDEPLPAKNHDHQLISLSRTGTHSDLFSKKNKQKATI